MKKGLTKLVLFCNVVLCCCILCLLSIQKHSPSRYLPALTARCKLKWFCTGYLGLQLALFIREFRLIQMYECCCYDVSVIKIILHSFSRNLYALFNCVYRSRHDRVLA
jgi:hypothetical protein